MSATGNQASHYNVMYDATNGAVLELLPVPTSGSYRVEYSTEFAGFASDSSVWPGPARSDELVGLRAAAMGMRKEGNDQGAQMVMGEYAELLQCVQDMAGWFDMRNPPVIRDVHGGLSSPRDPFDYDIGV
jgi:hypothetical protein